MFVFFYSIEKRLSKKYRGIFGGRTSKGAKPSQRLVDYKWHIIKYNIAESGIFNQPNLTPYESVNRANLHDVMRYQNVRNIEQDERNRVNK